MSLNSLFTRHAVGPLGGPFTDKLVEGQGSSWDPVKAPTSLEKPSTPRGGMEQQHLGVSQPADPTPLQGEGAKPWSFTGFC